MKKLVLVIIILLLSPLLAQAQSPPDSINNALADMSRRVGQSVTLNSLSRWSWSDDIFNDASLGCPQSGQVYAQITQRAYTFLLTYQGVTFDYRAARDGSIFFLCNEAEVNTANFANAAPTLAPTTAPSGAVSENPVSLPPSNFYPCPNALTGDVPSRLNVGFAGRYAGRSNLSLSSQPSRTAAALGTLAPDQTFTVVGGPSCDATFTWWQIDLGGLVGWAPEVDPANLNYWLETTAGSSLPTVPLPANTAINNAQPITPSNAAQLRQLARQDGVSGLLLTAQPPIPPDNLVIIIGENQIDLYANIAPNTVAQTLPLNGQVFAATLNTDDSAILAIQQTPQGIGLVGFSTTGGGSGGGSLGADFTGGIALLAGQNLVAIGGANVVWLYDPGTQQIVADLPTQANSVRQLAAGDVLAAAYAGGVALLDVTTRSEIGIVEAPAPFDIAFNPSGDLLAIIQNTEVILWDVATQSQRAAIPIQMSAAQQVAFSPDGALLVVVGENLQIWDLESGERLALFDENAPLSAAAFSPDGRYLNILTTENAWQVWGVVE